MTSAKLRHRFTDRLKHNSGALRVGVVVYGSVGADTVIVRGFNSVDVRSDKQELPALFLFALDKPFDVAAVVFSAGVFKSVGGDYEHRVLGHVLRSCVSVDISDVLYRSADCVEQRRTAAHRVVILGHRLNLLKRQPVVEHNALMVEQHRGNIRLAVLLFLLFNHSVKAADCVLFKSAHRTAAVENENDFSDVVVKLFCHNNYLRKVYLSFDNYIIDFSKADLVASKATFTKIFLNAIMTARVIICSLNQSAKA